MIPVQLNFSDGPQKKFLLPTGFEELTEEQYVKSFAVMKRAEVEPSCQWMLLPLLMKISINDLRELNGVQRVQLLARLEFLYDLDKLPGKQMVKRVYAPTSHFGAISLYGPGDLLKHLTFGEFLAVESKLDRYYSNNDLLALDQLCGILYRKSSTSRKKYSDRRIPFEEGLVESYGKLFAKVGPNMKVALLMNYDGAKRQFRRIYKNVFPADIQVSQSAEKQKPRGSSSMSWLNTLVNMAHQDVNKMAQIEKTSLHTVLKVLDEMVKRNQEMKNEALKHRH
ncbi:hypothetical protein SAMN05216327_101194 [Dyadobacter sp. SG02]|uniref:hypothetical protein n=1 Tax=Dyadobacter sp. SG02 TaxID=1855291 RepID=UPI0008BEA687|nr:hypothetical protein [Dyadobacter sp. SG02]SEI39416.1 hypothetical protein SAMN05216327_101194 [Dyadobacter sp. SG02]